MPSYKANVLVEGKTKTIKIIQASFHDAQKEIQSLYPKGRIDLLEREDSFNDSGRGLPESNKQRTKYEPF